ncbi:EAL domain-containing protein [Pseudomonas sp. DG56-2]|uniref:EAL domain-containing protein n=1 Tax=Pseudomonas sp. DG56-2 TaxID=2320270 RepID=UPI0010A5C6B8|nr:EAL domain-containing protein [Pseudomonas sp. DG56-2]
MKRSRIRVFGVLAGALCVVVCLTSSAYLGWLLVLHDTEAQLDDLAELAVRRADSTLAQAGEALRQLADSGLPACSPSGIEQMRLIALNTLFVKSVGYTEEDVYACSSSGAWAPEGPTFAEDFQTSEGVYVSLNGHTDVNAVNGKLTLQYAAFRLLVDPEPLQDTSLKPGFRLALGAGSGRWMEQRHADGFTQLLTLVHEGRRPMLVGDYIYKWVTHGNWQAVVALSREALLANLWRKQLIALPIGVAVALYGLREIARYTNARLSPMAELRGAIEQGNIHAFYQPIIDLHSGRCVGAEALVRLKQSDGTWATPERFLTLAEESDLIEDITENVLLAVCDDLGEYLRSDPCKHVSINLAARDICSGRYLDVLSNAIARAGINAQQVWLEVTESSLLDFEPACEHLTVSRQRGHPIALDDFGTGYSSLQYVQHLPIDLLKIDRTFVARIDDDKACPVLELTIALAQEMGLVMVAEGIETQQQVAFLRTRGIEFGQGWLFGKPMPVAEFIAYSEHRAATRQLINV